jgi:thioesterase domain-containing protein
MAARYIQEIRRVQPEGPYHLGGFSFGGPVAYEMARQLTQQGQAVGLVALLDPVDSLKAYDDEPEDPEPSREPADSPLAAGFRAVKARLVALRGSPGPSPERRVQDACTLAAVSYAPGVYDGKVTLFKASRSEDLHTGARWPWDKVVKGELETVEVPGGHRTIMEEPDVRQLAYELTRALSRAQTP